MISKLMSVVVILVTLVLATASSGVAEAQVVLNPGSGGGLGDGTKNPPPVDQTRCQYLSDCVFNKESSCYKQSSESQRWTNFLEYFSKCRSGL